eukprot:scaffold211_cov443-Pavlova_lutheri.AAC.3
MFIQATLALAASYYRCCCYRSYSRHLRYTHIRPAGPPSQSLRSRPTGTGSRRSSHANGHCEATDKILPTGRQDPYYVGPYTIKKVLQNGAYQLDLPPGSAFFDRIHADRIEPWVDSDLTLFPMDEHLQPARAPLPDTLDMHTNSATYRIRRFRLRDYATFPTQPVRYWVESSVSDSSQRFFWIDETAALLEEFLPLEEANGCIPEQGITPSNYNAVFTHKKTAYLQSPSPIMIHTWTFTKLPFQTRRRPRFIVPTELAGQVVQELFHTPDRSDPAYFQGLVDSIEDGLHKIKLTDGKIDYYLGEQVRAMVYDPVAYISELGACCESLDIKLGTGRATPPQLDGYDSGPGKAGDGKPLVPWSEGTRDLSNTSRPDRPRANPMKPRLSSGQP